MNPGAKITGVAEAPAEIQAAVRIGTRAGLEELGAKGTDIVQRNITTPFEGKPAAVFSGNLAGSVFSDFQPLPDAAREIIGVGTSMGADRYAAPVETGARPHMPPPEALLPWVMKKFSVEDEKDALSLAFAVAKSIAKKGTQGHQMFSRGLEELDPMIVPALEKNIALALAQAGFAEVGA